MAVGTAAAVDRAHFGFRPRCGPDLSNSKLIAAALDNSSPSAADLHDTPTHIAPFSTMMSSIDTSNNIAWQGQMLTSLEANK